MAYFDISLALLNNRCYYMRVKEKYSFVRNDIS